jgi:hypothetical protein
VSLGDRRGWLLMLIQPLAVAGMVAAAALLIDGSRWIALVPGLSLLLAAWLGQAMHAHRKAIQLGASPGGEYQLALALPLVVAVLSGFWLVGGGLSSPGATVQHYVAAWQAARPADAQRLFAEPVDQAALAADWSRQRDYVTLVVGDAAQRFGIQSGLDPSRPFNSLRFEPRPSATDSVQAVIDVDVVRRRRVETSLFGVIPTASQETVLVERLGQIVLRAHAAPVPDWLPGAANPGQVWLIDEVQLDTGDG